jgi:DedD protein
MTQRESGQDFDPKHRIVGAIIVVALAVIFIPMILSNREAPGDRADAPSAAPRDTAADGNKVAVTKLPPPESTKAATDPAPAAEPSSDKPAEVAAPTEIKEAKAAATPPAPAKTPAGKTGADASRGGWVVQVGTFSNTANAARLEKKLRAEGRPLLVERISLEGHKAVRLRVGPFPDREAALKVRDRIHKEVGVKGVVLAYP